MDYETLKNEIKKYPDTMSENERNKAYNEGKKVDRIPFSVCGADSLVELYGYTIGQYRNSLDIQFDVAKKVKEEFGFGGMMIDTNLVLHGLGIAMGSTPVYPENSTVHFSDYLIKDYSILDNLVFDPVNNPYLQGMIKRAYEIKDRVGKQCSQMTGGAGPLSTAIALRSPTLFLKDMTKDKENVHRLLNFCVDSTLKWFEYNINEFGQMGVALCDPAASGNLISKKTYLEFSKPYTKKLLDGIKKLTGTTPGIHICGKTKHIWNDLIDLEFPSFSVDDCEDLAQLKNTVGKKIHIIGNVSPTKVLRFGTIDDVINAVQECLIKGSDNPCGFTLATGCQVPLGTPRENIEAYMYAARRYGRGAQKGKLCEGLYKEKII